MRNERGSAVVLVLLVLGVITLLAAGLMVQTRYDSKFNRAQGSHDKMVNLADGAARVALFGVTYETPGAYSGEAAMVKIEPGPASTDPWKTQVTIGAWQSKAWYLGATTNPQDMAGWEIGTGYYAQYWVAQGTGNRGELDKDSALSTVQVAGIKFTK
jgi:hypothetical protein